MSLKGKMLQNPTYLLLASEEKNTGNNLTWGEGTKVSLYNTQSTNAVPSSNCVSISAIHVFI